MGPLTLGHLFDTVGRKKMISGTYITAGILLIITAILFKNGSKPSEGVLRAGGPAGPGGPGVVPNT